MENGNNIVEEKSTEQKNKKSPIGLIILVVILMIGCLVGGYFLSESGLLNKKSADTNEKKTNTNTKKEKNITKENNNKTALKMTNFYLKSIAENWQYIFVNHGYYLNVDNEEEFLNKNIFDNPTARIIYVRSNLLKEYSTYDFKTTGQEGAYVKYDTFKEQFENTFSDKYNFSETLKNVIKPILTNENTFIFGDDANKYVSWNTTGTSSSPVSIEFEINNFELKDKKYIVTGVFYHITYSEYGKIDKQYNFTLKLTNSDDSYRIEELIFTK